MTQREKDIINFIFSFVKKNGIMPSTSQWGEHLGISRNLALYYNRKMVDNEVLVKKGHGKYMVNINMPDDMKKMFQSAK